MRLILSDGVKLDLPTYKDEERTIPMLYEDRLFLVNKIMEEYPHEFDYDNIQFTKRYGRKQDSKYKTKIRIDILSTYLIKSDMDYTDDVLSRYKEKMRPLQEVSFSQFSPTFIEICGLY